MSSTILSDYYVIVYKIHNDGFPRRVVAFGPFVNKIYCYRWAWHNQISRKEFTVTETRPFTCRVVQPMPDTDIQGAIRRAS